MIMEHQHKTFIAILSRLGPLRELAESAKKGKLLTKIFFQIMLNKVLESYK